MTYPRQDTMRGPVSPGHADGAFPLNLVVVVRISLSKRATACYGEHGAAIMRGTFP